MFNRSGHIIESFLGRYAFGQKAGAGQHRQSGKGIADRYSRFATEWQPHLESCRRVQREWSRGLNAAAHQSLIVLGAGRLFDFEKRLLAAAELSGDIPSFSQAAFIDVDSGCLPAWQECRKQFSGGAVLQFEILELTGRLVAWQQELPAAFGRLRQIKAENRWQEALAEVSRIGRGEISPAVPAIRPVTDRLKARCPSAVVSLNLLSQLPLAWQRAIEENLCRVFGARYVAERESEWLEVYRLGAETILREHAILLSSLGADSILLFSDIDYLHPRDSSKISTLEDLSWHFEPDQTEPFAQLRPAAGHYQRNGEASEVEIIDALAGSQLLEPTKAGLSFPGYFIADVESWLWHIVPRSGRREPRPEVHRVAALILKRSGNEAV